MQTITLPIWALAASAGMPTICLIWIVVALIRRRRKARRASAELNPAQPIAAPMTGQSQFRQDLLTQQIDIVFSGLAALIETERLKLNALLNQNLYPACPPQSSPTAEEVAQVHEMDDVNLDNAASPVGRQVADAVASGQAMDHVATQLGLSRAEVALAMKLNQSQTDTPHRKLEAVA